MKILLPILLIFVFVLSSCNTPPTESVAIDSSKTPLSHPVGEILYIANTNSKTYHLSTCRFAINLKEENKHETSDLNFLVTREFTPCKICIDTND